MLPCVAEKDTLTGGFVDRSGSPPSESFIERGKTPIAAEEATLFVEFGGVGCERRGVNADQIQPDVRFVSRDGDRLVPPEPTEMGDHDPELWEGCSHFINSARVSVR